MKTTMIKTKIPALILLLLLTMPVAFFALPNAAAHDPPLDIPIYTYLTVFPSPVGVDQPVNIFAWIDKVPPTASGEFGDRWEDLTITVTSPDGNVDTLGPYDSDPVGTIFLTYTPTQTGTYNFKFDFPGQTLVGNNPPPGGWDSLGMFGGASYLGDYFEPSSSEASIVVQQEQIPTDPSIPLPTDYWSRPINDAIVGWAPIAGNWLGDGQGNPYTTAPESPHIVWTKPITFGGVADGKFGNDGYYTGLSYESYWSPPIIISGVLYYNTPNPPMYGFHAVDLQTGEEIWYQNSTGPLQVSGGFLNQQYPQLSFGQLLNYNSPNQHGVIPYLWSTYTDNGKNMWAMYDAFTGNWICTLEGVPSGGAMFGASNRYIDSAGSILLYNVDMQTKTLSVWNSTACIQDSFPSNSPLADNGYWLWRPTLGGTIDASSGLIANVSLQTSSPLPPFASNVGIDAANQIMVYSTGMGMLGMGTFPTPTSYTQFGVSLKPSNLGEVLWVKENPWPDGNVTLSVDAIGEGYFGVFAKETCQWYCYSTLTGEKLWGPSEPETDLHMYGVSAGFYNGKLYSGDSIGEGGTMYCYDAQTGNLDWSMTTESMGYTGYWPNTPISFDTAVDGKLYCYGSEHSPGPTLEPGFKLRCLTADSGDELWQISFWASGGMGGTFAIADGYLVGLNAYDNQIYCFGKGQTETTVTAPNVAVPLGNSIVISGTVTDLSPGAEGKPAISDGDMQAWMEHVYMQKPISDNIKGVPVVLTAVDSNGHSQEIGTVESDSNGFYSIMWQPPTEDKYTIVATFEGSKSYFGSCAETAIGVGSASPAVPASPSVAPPPSDGTLSMTLYISVAAIAIIVVIIVAALVLRKRK